MQRRIRVASKICAIVGVGATMGREIAKAFAKEGYDLALIARDADHLGPYVEEVTGLGQKATAVSADVTREDDVKKAFDQIKSEMGDPEVLVYNVATMVKTPPSELTAQEVIDTLPAMFFGAIYSVKQVLPAMKKNGRGTILTTGGGFGILPATFSASHSIGKAALRNYTQNLHQELSESGIHVATVTITRPVQAGTEYDGEMIAGLYVKLHRQPRGSWDWEIIHKEL